MITGIWMQALGDGFNEMISNVGHSNNMLASIVCRE